MGNAIICRRNKGNNRPENNGEIWTRSDSALKGGQIHFATYGKNRWVSGNYDGLFYSDDNGKTWVASDVTESCNSAIYANDTWVAFSENYAYLYYSTDGKAWTKVVLSTEKSTRINFIIHKNNLWVAGGYGGLYYSTDGINWTQSDLTGDISFATDADNLWVSGGSGGIYYSSDGKSWTHGNVSSNFYPDFAKHANGVWVSGSLSADSGLYYSEDGVNWTQTNLTTGGFKTITHSDGMWLVGGYSSNGIYYSIDGQTWVQTNLATGNFYAITKANNLWVTGNYGNGSSSTGLYFSTDGKTWTSSNITTGSFEHIKKANGMWIAGSGASNIDYSGVYFSKNGKHWIQSISSDSGITNFKNYCIRFLENANNVWLAGTYSSTYTYPTGVFYSSRYIMDL